MFSIEFIKKVFFTLIIEEYDVFFPLIFFFFYFIFSLLIKKERNILTQIIILFIPFFISFINIHIYRIFLVQLVKIP